MSKEIIIYSAQWCADCRRSKRLLDSLNVEYLLIDVESDALAEAKAIEINGGKLAIPVIVFPDGTHLTEPSDIALTEKIKELAII